MGPSAITSIWTPTSHVSSEKSLMFASLGGFRLVCSSEVGKRDTDQAVCSDPSHVGSRRCRAHHPDSGQMKARTDEEDQVHVRCTRVGYEDAPEGSHNNKHEADAAHGVRVVAGDPRMHRDGLKHGRADAGDDA